MKLSSILFKEIKIPEYPSWMTYLLLSILIGFSLYWFFFTQKNLSSEDKTKKEPDKNIELRFSNIEIRGRKEGVALWTIKADKVDVNRTEEGKEQKVFFKKNPHGSFYNIKDWSLTEEEKSSGDVPERLRTFDWKANYAEYDEEEKVLLLKNKVYIETDDKDRIYTNHLLWESKEEKITCNSRTTIIGHRNGLPVIQADRIQGDIKMNIIDLEGNVRIKTDISEDQELK